MAPPAPRLRRADAPAGEKVPVAFQISAKSSCVDCTEKPSGADVKAGCIDKPVVKAGCIEKGGGLWELPDEEVQWVLSRRKEDIPNDLFGPDCVESVKAVRDELFAFQEWVRAEYDANDGRVFVDDKFVAEKEEHEQWMSSQWDTRTEPLDLGGLNLSDRLSDFYDSEDDEAEVQPLCTN